MANVAKIFGTVLREVRSQSRISQERLAALADLDRTYISLLERGLRQPSLETIIKICDALELSLVDLSTRVQRRLDEDRGS